MLTSFLSRQPVFDTQGLKAVGAQIFTFDAGTSNARVAYRDGSNNPQPWTQPFNTDVNGQIPPFWIVGTTAYRVRILSAQNVPLLDIDNLTAEIAVPSAPPVTNGYSTGDTIFRFDTAEKAGFVKLNGKTLGSAASLADYRDDSSIDLYTLLYNGILALTVSGGRGASAAADFAAAKTLTLPDMKSRSPFGLDTMGGAAANRLTGVTFSSGNSSTLGSTGGEALHVLTIAELAAHNHTGATDASGAHTPTGTISSTNAHNHTGTTDAGTPHHHSYVTQAPAALNIGSTLATVNVGTQTLTTTDESAHTHTVTTSTVAAHNHTFTGDAVASHTHTYTGNNTGSGTAHNTMPPFILGTWYCKI
jgi:hypothetical protein